MDYYSGVTADQHDLQNKFGTAGIRRKPVALMSDGPPASTLLEQTSPFLKQVSPVSGQDAHLLKDWPTEPDVVKSSIISIVTDVFVDIVLLGLSLTFFTFGLMVRHYDQAPVALHESTINTLLEATKYVGKT